MQTIVVTPPTAPLVDADLVRQRLGIADASQTARLEPLVAAATALLDGPSGWLGRALGVQTLEHRRAGFPRCDTIPLVLAYPPIQSIVSIAYTDPQGAAQTLDVDTVVFDGESDLYPLYGHLWPDARYAPGSVVIRYSCGYASVPEPIIQAIILQVASMNAMLRDDPSMSSETVPGVYSRSWSGSMDVGSIYDTAAARLLSPYRVFA